MSGVKEVNGSYEKDTVMFVLGLEERERGF